MESFISTSDLGLRMRRDLSDDDAAFQAVDAACQVCRTVAEQTFNLVEDETIRLDGTGIGTIMVPEGPVLELISVHEDDEELVADDDFSLYDNGVLARQGGVWSPGRLNIEVTYSHGYEEVPADVSMVALTLAERLFSQGAAVFEALGSYQVRYAAQAADLSRSEEAILARYRQAKQSWATAATS